MTAETLRPEQLAAALRGYRDALSAEQATINRLNVFPVPDGDTGTNMLLTVEAVVEALRAPGAAADFAVLSSTVGRSALMGARGNSGVILCQVLRGLTGELAPLGKAGASDVARALSAASEQARAAVLRPSEGTILTVAAAAASAALRAGEEGADVVATLEAARGAAVAALWATPRQLRVLASAGVVDAGGAGLTLLLDALLSALDDRLLPGLELPESVRSTLASAGADRAGTDGAAGQGGAREGADGDGSETCRYEVMYLLEAPDEAIGAFKEVWAGIGESIVVVGGGGLWSCHIHTDDIGAAVEAALDAGRPREIRVTDLAEQVEEESWVRQEAGRLDDEDPGAPAPPRRTHVVAVASGAGIRRIFRSLGADAVVAGGQSMNPSTAQVLEAIERVPGPGVVVLPNNPNIVPVAEQAAQLSDKHVVVVRTRAIQEGFAALLEYDPEAVAEENAARMAEAAERVLTGEVTRAVRASQSDAGPVRPGDYIGLDRRGIVAVSADLAGATCGLLEALLAPEHELVTLFEGAGATAAATRRVGEWLSAHRPGVEVERHVGGQPLYPYLVTVE